jgi:FAD/FMN-containing dehydrogenase
MTGKRRGSAAERYPDVNERGDAIDRFKAGFRGQVLAPGDPGYDGARIVWNAMIDRRPALIARCAGTADVMRAVALAREQELLVSVRGGGHNIAGSAVCDDGLMIDLSGMRSVRVDPAERRAYVEPGATLADFDHEAQAFALGTPLGINSTTGVAGLTLGGGFGWLSRKYGLTVDNLLSAEVVTADARRVRASAEENPDLFWAIRGGGGNFGIVTLFEFRLHPVGPEVLAGLIAFPFESAGSVLRRYREFVDDMPTDLNVWAILRKAPPLPFLPETVHGREVVFLAVFYDGDLSRGMKAVEPLRDFAKAHGEHVGPQPFAAWQKAFDPLLAPGARNYWKSHNFKELNEGALDVVVQYGAKLPSPQCEIFIGVLGGQAGRVATDATAYHARDAEFVMNTHARWDGPGDDAKCVGWARAFYEKTKPFASGGAYVNFMTEEEGERVQAAYGGNYDRLSRIKGRYDPQNLFRMNQNILPSR